MRVKFLPFLVAIATALAITLYQASEAGQTPLVRMTRSACYGTCPVYKLEIYPDGKVIFFGEDYTLKLGKRETSIDQATITQIKDIIAQSGFYNLKENCCNSYDFTDMPSVKIEVKLKTRSNSVVHYHGSQSAPTFLRDLEDRIDQLSGATKWIGTIQERKDIHLH